MTKKQASDLIDGLLNCPMNCKTGYVKKISNPADPEAVPVYRALDWDGQPVQAEAPQPPTTPKTITAKNVTITALDDLGNPTKLGSGYASFVYSIDPISEKSVTIADSF